MNDLHTFTCSFQATVHIFSNEMAIMRLVFRTTTRSVWPQHVTGTYVCTYIYVQAGYMYIYVQMLDIQIHGCPEQELQGHNQPGGQATEILYVPDRDN